MVFNNYEPSFSMKEHKILSYLDLVHVSFLLGQVTVEMVVRMQPHVRVLHPRVQSPEGTLPCRPSLLLGFKLPSGVRQLYLERIVVLL